MRDLRIRLRQAGELRNVSDRLSLEVPAAAAAVPGARRAITRLCEHLGLAGELTDRIRLAVTEACTNCVLHAYGDVHRRRRSLVEARVDGDWLLLVVRDYGRRNDAGPDIARDTLQLGLRLIEELADSACVSHGRARVRASPCASRSHRRPDPPR